eukprot:scaffold17839_cov72-Cyclotella_meneghiniana.AAC.2
MTRMLLSESSDRQCLSLTTVLIYLGLIGPEHWCGGWVEMMATYVVVTVLNWTLREKEVLIFSMGDAR